MFCLYLLFMLISSTFTYSCSINSIKILSDFSKGEDLQFFKVTLPWIVENIGPRIKIRYYFKGGQNTDITKECILTEMKSNIHYQVTYLNKEAQGIPTNEAVSNFPINNKKYALCLKRRFNYFRRAATKEFSRIKSRNTPVIILPGKIEISGAKPESILKSICALFRRDQPLGCINTVPYPKENNLSSGTPKTDKATETVIKDTESTSEHTTVTSDKTASGDQESVTLQKETNSSTPPNPSKSIEDTPIPSTDKETNPELNPEASG